MRPVSSATFAFLLLAGCDRSPAPAASPTTAASPVARLTPATSDPVIAQFWKDVAGVHFTEDRSHRGERLPDAALTGPDGRRTRLSLLKGKPVLVNFWARWCVPCRAEMPTLDRVAHDRQRALVTVAVNEDSVEPRARSLGELATDPAIRRISDPNLALAKSHAGGGLPTTVLYGSDGRERWRLVGVLDWTKPQAQALLREAI